MKISVSLLAYNEGESIAQTIDKSYKALTELGYDFELWIMDNHSTDNTVQVLESLFKTYPKLRHFRQKENVGYAMNSLSSFKVPQADILVTLDGDGQFDVKDVKSMVASINQGNDLVVGWRVKRNDPIDRVIMNKVFNKITQWILSCKLHDLNCGYRAMTKKAADLISVRYKEKFVGPEVFARACQYKMKVSEVPVAHYERTAGASVFSGNKIASIINMLKYLWKLRQEIKHENVLTHSLVNETFK